MKWLEDTCGLKLSQGTIVKTFKQSTGLLQKESNMIKYPTMELTLFKMVCTLPRACQYEWWIVKREEKYFSKPTHLEVTSFEFSNS